MERLLIKKDTVIKDTLADYGIYVKHVPFILFPKLKEPYSHSWYDEDGDDEYIPTTPRYESYNMTIDFVYKGAVNTANSNIKSFLEFLVGGYLTIYDEYTGIGRQKIRYVEVGDDASLYRRGNDVVEFNVTFKVNDPNTQVTLAL